jgi:hypothetical protein
LAQLEMRHRHGRRPGESPRRPRPHGPAPDQ